MLVIWVLAIFQRWSPGTTTTEDGEAGPRTPVKSTGGYPTSVAGSARARVIAKYVAKIMSTRSGGRHIAPKLRDEPKYEKGVTITTKSKFERWQ